MPQLTAVRAGVWKPRTRPGCFEGLGEPALQWMSELQRQYNIPFCCEVARPEQVELCLHYGIRLLWIGARTTANPIMVDELCSALRGSKASVMVKNPVCPDVRLWLGAFERLHAAGIEDVAAVHRGFAMYHNQGYRNAPLWEVAMELRRELPKVPILCDPSHIGGQRELVAPIAATAMQMDYDGLMVEVHPHPEEALSDGQQQLRPEELSHLMAELHTHRSQPSTTDRQQINALRAEIDAVDSELLRLLAHRLAIAKEIGAVKKEAEMSVYQAERWSEVMSSRLSLANTLGIEADFVKEIFEKIHAESVRMQL